MNGTQGVEAAAARRFNGGIRRAVATGYGHPDGDQWQYLRRLVATEYPFCTMLGVNVAGGAIVSCDNIQQRLAFGPAKAAAVDAAFDDRWRALKDLCGKIKTGRIAELTFIHGRPVEGQRSVGARRFKRLLETPQ